MEMILLLQSFTKKKKFRNKRVLDLAPRML
jgi:hypothetical protein